MPRALPQAHPELPEPSSSDERLIKSFERHLRSEKKSARTQEIYLGAARLLARWAAGHLDGGLDEMTKDDVKSYLIWMHETARKRDGQPYAEGYVSNLFRANQAFFKWLQEDEGASNPMTGVKPPTVSETLVPIVQDGQMDDLLARFEKKNDFDSRRNYAIFRLFLGSGIRLAELTTLTLESVDLDNGTMVVIGKGNRPRRVPIDAKTVTAVDRYLRVRGKHKMAKLDALWLGSNHRQPLLPNGIRQCVRKTARELGFHLHPHMMRHTFAHRWLDAGGSEGDLMEIMGWKSGQMLRRYGASARSARAKRSFDKLDVLGGR